MRVAVIGSRNLQVRDLEKYLPANTSCIVTGGARGVDTSARIHARRHGIPLREFLPDYHTYGYLAPLIRNGIILENSDLVLAFWDGYSRGTAYVIKKCREKGIECRVFMQKDR